MTTQPPMPPSAEYLPAAGARPPRPSTVTVAGYLMILIAVLELLSLIPTIATAGPLKDAFKAAYQDSPVKDSASTIAVVGIAVGVGIAVLFAVGYIVLGLLDLRGKQPARIITWVVAGLLLCCQGPSIAGNSFSTSFSGGGNTNGVDADALKRVLESETPGWVQPVQATIIGIMVLSAIAVIILLAMPASNAYFRKPVAPQFMPPAYPTV